MINTVPQPAGEVRYLCDIALGWRSFFCGQHIILVKEDGSLPPYAILLSTIKQGDLLPRETDKPLEL